MENLLSKPDSKRKAHVLIASGHTMLREGLCKLLEARQDIGVVGQSSNVDECVATLAELLLDLDIPGKDAFALLAEANARSTRVIVLTQREDEFSAMRAMFLGAGCVFLKTSPMESLNKCIRAVESGEV